MNNGMTYEKILRMISDSASNYFYNRLNYDGMRKSIVECATKVYIAQMQLEKEKLQQEYDDLYEGHEKLSTDWAKLKKENRELNRKYNELLKESNRKSNEPVAEKSSLNDLTPEEKEGFLKETLENMNYRDDEDFY